MPKKKTDHICEACGGPFMARPSDKQRFCSHRCAGTLNAQRAEEKKVARFWSKVDRSDEQGCWLFTRFTDRDGYGMFSVASGYMRAHRFSWTVSYGPIPDGLGVLHHCDNPPCVRPDHLFLGTDLDNVRDRDSKGRQATGDRLTANMGMGPRHGSLNANARLTWDQVREIRRRRADGESYRGLARAYGVTHRMVRLIVLNENWVEA